MHTHQLPGLYRTIFIRNIHTYANLIYYFFTFNKATLMSTPRNDRLLIALSQPLVFGYWEVWTFIDWCIVIAIHCILFFSLRSASCLYRVPIMLNQLKKKIKLIYIFVLEKILKCPEKSFLNFFIVCRSGFKNGRS